MRVFFVFILASRKNGVLYVGVTNNIWRRIREHQSEVNKGFTSRYHINRLVYVETTHSILAAIQWEKQIKWWKRAWKIQLIEKNNSDWRDLSNEL